MQSLLTVLMAAKTPDLFLGAVADTQQLLGWTDAELARRAGISRAAIHNIKNQARDSPRTVALSIATALVDGLKNHAADTRSP